MSIQDEMDDLTLKELRRLVFEVEEAAYPRVLVRLLLNRYDRLAADRARTTDALTAIAREDELVNANKDAFSAHAYRRCREIAAAALASLAEEGANSADPR